MKTKIAVRFAVVAAVALAGCSVFTSKPTIQAAMAPTAGNTATGTVSFTAHDGKVLVEADIQGLTPGLHGFHIHEKGDCSAPDATSAGGHFNPTGAQHGDPNGAVHHLGDMPMLTASDAGKAKLRVELNSVAVDGPNSIVGKAVIIHAKPDDFQTQPTGNSGGRVACGVIVEK